MVMVMMNTIVEALRKPLSTQYILYKYLKYRSEFDTHCKWLETYVLPEGYFFRRDYICEIINYDLFTNEPKLPQVLFFDNYTEDELRASLTELDHAASHKSKKCLITMGNISK